MVWASCINQQQDDTPTDMATGQSDLRSLLMVICAFQVTLDYAKLTILTNQDIPDSIYGELVNNRSVTNFIVFMVFGGIHHYNIWV